ncbi:hypothetical protein EJ07DRAFT_149725 [Lizonia empirigonia]|nr:hypothetical protein EJ07DRAFT_149725 [Lizonia empirigonia]
MSTTWRKNYFFKRIFKARRERTKRRKKRELFLGLPPRSPSQLRCRGESNPGAGMLTGFPFEGGRKRPH